MRRASRLAAGTTAGTTAGTAAPTWCTPRLEVHAGEVISFEQFLSAPGPALALDGYVAGPTRIENGFDHASFNHHEGCARLTTRATCEQVALALHGRLGGWWRTQGLTAHVNDADPDVALSCWLLGHPDQMAHPGVSRLVTAESWLDSTSGCIAPFLDEDEAAALAWVFQPCFTVLTGRTSGELRDVIDEVALRIDGHLAGRGDVVHDARDYHVDHRLGPVAVVSAASPLARSRFVGDGIEVYVLVRGQHLGRWHVSIGLSDPMTPGDLAVSYATLNAIEGLGGEQRWSGSDTVGGSPREHGTSLNPVEVAEILSACTSGYRPTRR